MWKGICTLSRAQARRQRGKNRAFSRRGGELTNLAHDLVVLLHAPGDIDAVVVPVCAGHVGVHVGVHASHGGRRAAAGLLDDARVVKGDDERSGSEGEAAERDEPAATGPEQSISLDGDEIL